MAIERRYSARIPIPANQSQAILRAGQRTFEVRLVDASSFGFGIICPPQLKARAGDLLRLCTTGGWVEVRVARVEDREGERLLGLSRERELGMNPDASCFDVIGGRTVATILIAAFTIGLAFGASMWISSKDGWKQAQSVVNTFVSATHDR